MKETRDYSIHDDLPESLNRQNVKELARLFDGTLRQYDSILYRVLIYPAIDTLPSDLVNALAVQLHCDFYDYSLPLPKRRALVKESIAWHRIKGTPAAVEMLCRILFHDAHVREWYEYGGRPYFFRVTQDISDDTEDVTREDIERLKRAIYAGKNVRSWLDIIEFLYHIEENIPVEEAVDMRTWLSFHDIIPYGTNDPVASFLTRSGILRHGFKACHGRDARGSDIYHNGLPPFGWARGGYGRYGHWSISTDDLVYWPVWHGEEEIHVGESILRHMGMDFSIGDTAEAPTEETLTSAEMAFHDLVPYGVEIPCRDGIREHGIGARRNGFFQRDGTAQHNEPSVTSLRHYGRRDLETERAFYFIGCGFEETVEAVDRGAMAVSLPPFSDRVKEPKDAGGSAALEHFLRHDGRIRHGGGRARGTLSQSFSLDSGFSFRRECRNGRLAREGRTSHRTDAIDFPA